ncbi:putative solute-binding protein [Aquabacterium sp. G14]|jgi:hypothetical protein|uniref:putative solute-binding protein n=1 Tax=Aquabacterium sp. G14 TaxID=3130164 RepID=UPI0030AE9D08
MSHAPRSFLRPQSLALAAAALLSSVAVSAQAKNVVCVWDVAGKTGDVFATATDYALAMQKHGATLELKGYTDERVAIEDFRAGQCDAVVATSFRTRQFNNIAGSIDSIGSTLIIKNGKVDIDAGYEVLRKVIQVFSSPAASKMMVDGNYEVGGIFPLGAAYPIVRDRKNNTVESLAGKKIAAFDYDKAQGMMIQRIGAQPVSVDVSNLGTKFNNGLLDMVTLPAVAYKPFELQKGIGKTGGIGRLPIVIPTVQIMLNKGKFPEGFGDKSRQFWLAQFDRALNIVKTAEKGIPAAVWEDFPAESIPKYAVMYREARLDIAKQGIYNKTTLNVMKKARCSVNPSDAECATPREID